jgi:hypothetical protein
MGIPMAVMLLLLAVGASVGADEPPTQPTPELVSALAAERAAQELFARTFGCGSLEGPARDEGDHWAFSARVGYVAELDPEPILVDKRTGIATWATHDRVQRERQTPWQEF